MDFFNLGKKEVASINFTVHAVHCQRNITICPLCNEAVPRSQFNSHNESNHKEVSCQKCGVTIETAMIFQHQAEECPRRMVACEFCELEVAAAEMPGHKEYCGSRTDRCKGCTKYVMFKYLQFHYAHDHKYLTPDEKDEDSSDTEGSECPICLGPVTLPLALECGHVFCMVCVKGIANTTRNCAICRRDIPRDMLMDIRFCREEDVIKNYVNKPKEKKTRSKSVPGRYSSTSSTSLTPTTSRRLGNTTEDYDNMVSALLSTRTSHSSYRYQRPANTHTPPSYTPYSSSSSSSSSNTSSYSSRYPNSSSTTTTTTSSSNTYSDESCKSSKKDEDDDCCCSSSASTSSSSSTSTTTTSSTPKPPSTNSPSLSSCKSSKTETSSSSHPATTSTSSRSSIATTFTTPSSRSTPTPHPVVTASRPAPSPPTATTSSKSSSTPISSTSSPRSDSTTSSRSLPATTSTSNSRPAPAPPSTTPSSSTRPSSVSRGAPAPSTSTNSSCNTSSSCSSTASSSTPTTSQSQTSSSSSSPSPSSYANGARPRRPTSLALASSTSESPSMASGVSVAAAAANAAPSSRISKSGTLEPPANATQEEYDRWLAFQLAQADDDISVAEFNRKHRPTFRRSVSMPERKESSSESESDDDSDTPSSSMGRPPTSPRTTNNTSASSSSSSSNSASSSSSGRTLITKSSSDSNATAGAMNSVLSTGARPKAASGLKKRVSFKEDVPPPRREAPPVPREAPVLLPCEFCEEMFPERDLMRHQTGCERNETQLPRSSRLLQRSGSSSSSATITVTTASPSSVSGSSNSSSSGRPPSLSAAASTPAYSSIHPTTSLGTSSSAPLTTVPPTPPSNRSPPKSPAATSPTSSQPPPRPPNPPSHYRHSPAPASVRHSPAPHQNSADNVSISTVVVTTTRPTFVSPAISRTTSVSPTPFGSLTSSSVSSTPSASSSTSPAPFDSLPNSPSPLTSNDVEAEVNFEEGESANGPFARPRRGRLLSSAIFSWKSISGDKGRPRYTRSNTAPLEDTGMDVSPQPTQVLTSLSASQVPATIRNNEGDNEDGDEDDDEDDSEEDGEDEEDEDEEEDEEEEEEDEDEDEDEEEEEEEEKPSQKFNKGQSTPSPQPLTNHNNGIDQVFIKNPNKYKAPLPPVQPNRQPNNKNISNNENNNKYNNMNGHPSPPKTQNKTQSSHINGVIKFDSKPMMNGRATPEGPSDVIPCEFCKEVFPPEKFQSHQSMCEGSHLDEVQTGPTPPKSSSSVDQNSSGSSKNKSPVPVRHNKGPAPAPPGPSKGRGKKLERSHSVKEESRSFRRYERASSILDSRQYSLDSPSNSRRWGSRETLLSNGYESSSALSSGANVGGGGGSTYGSSSSTSSSSSSSSSPSSSSSSSSSSYSGRSNGWASHVTMLRDDVRSRANAAALGSNSSSSYYDDGGELEPTEVDGRGSKLSSSYLLEMRAALHKTGNSHPGRDSGGVRYRERSLSRNRPSSMFSTSSSTWDSNPRLYDVQSPSRTSYDFTSPTSPSFNIADAFSKVSHTSKPQSKLQPQPQMTPQQVQQPATQELQQSLSRQGPPLQTLQQPHSSLVRKSIKKHKAPPPPVLAEDEASRLCKDIGNNNGMVKNSVIVNNNETLLEGNSDNCSVRCATAGSKNEISKSCNMDANKLKADKNIKILTERNQRSRFKVFSYLK
ncbi:uncharacterized protein LOC143037466 isoform X2 [Oratosquilla oratoria]|uniref:uncharacterized protein LOC143037466 isoform X2 n=1 Tax=Oratosquilla oratoria TaxID=337810 RepID=UPI003F774052